MTLWDEFQKTPQVIQEELGIRVPEPEVKKLETARIGVDYDLSIETTAYRVWFHLQARTESEDYEDWYELSYDLKIVLPNGTVDFEKPQQFKRDGSAISADDWLRQSFYERNIKTGTDLPKLFGDKYLRVISLPSYDSARSFRAFLLGVATTDPDIPMRLYRFRHMENEYGRLHEFFSYSFETQEFWAVFPYIAGMQGGASYSDFLMAEEAITEGQRKIRISVSHHDYDYDEFMRFIVKNVYDFRRLIPHQPLEAALDYALRIVFHTHAVPERYRKELDVIDEEFQKEDYGRALRDMRVLVEDATKAVLAAAGIAFGEKDELHVLRDHLVRARLIDGRLVPWFDAFASYPNLSSHQIFPTESELDENTRNIIRISVILGKQLLLELFEKFGSLEYPE